jgi:hypothetical protein
MLSVNAKLASTSAKSNTVADAVISAFELNDDAAD